MRSRRDDDQALGAFLEELAEEEGGDADVALLIAAFAAAIPPSTPPAGGRAALWAAATDEGRLARFAEAIARMIAVTRADAQALLDGLREATWEPGPVAGCELLWVPGGPSKVGYVRGFVRLAAGTAFPAHEHLGDEEVLVLQGAMDVTDGDRVLPGETTRRDAGTSHAFTAAPGGPDLLFFVVAREGVRIGDVAVLHRDGAI